MSFSGLCLSCCSGVTRTAFLVVALPLLLAGSLFSEIATQLVHQSVKHLEYAAMEEAAGWELQAQADRNIATAALDQTEAEELEAHAAELEGKAAGEEEGSSGSKGSGEGEGEASGEAGGDVGEAAGSAAEEGAAAGTDSAAEVAAAVHEVAAAAEGAGAAAASEASAAGAGAAGAAAAEVAVDAAAVGAAGAAGATAGSAAALAGAAGVVAVTAPKVVQGAEAQYASMSDEVQAARDESLATEKEAEAGGLEGSVPVYEASAVSAHEAAAKSVAVAAGFLVTSQVFQVAALICEGPVAAVVLARWVLSAAGGAFCATPKGFGLEHWTSLGVTRISMALGVSALLLGAWSDTVLEAAERHDQNGIFDALDKIPGLVAKAQGKEDRNSAGTTATANATSSNSGGSSSTSGSSSVALQSRLRRLGQGFGEELYEKAGSLLKEAGHETGVAAEKSEEFLRKETLRVAKEVAVKAPHTGTTTVTPQTTGPPPETEDALGGAVVAFKDNATFWLTRILQALLLITLLFIAVELGIGLGRHGSFFPAVTDALSHWLSCTAILVAIWLLSIMLAAQLRPYAEQALDAHDHVHFPTLGLALIVVSLLAAFLHAYLLRKSRCGTSLSSGYSKVGVTEAGEVGPTESGATTAAYFCLASVTFAFGFVLEAIEGPAFSSAVGGAYHSYQKTQYLMPLVPALWPVLQSHYHAVLTRIAMLAGALVIAVLCAGAAMFSFSRTRKPISRWTRDPRDPRMPLE